MNYAVRRTSTLAMVSLIFGLLGWTFLPFIGSVVAIITGHMARSEIRNGRGLVEGDGLAVGGLVLGWLVVAGTVLAFLAFVLFFGGLVWLGSLGH